MLRRRRALFLVAAVVAGALGMAWQLRKAPTNRPAGAAALTLNNARWEVGESREFSANLTSHVSMSGQSILDIKLGARWRVVRLSTLDSTRPDLARRRFSAQLDVQSLSLPSAPNDEASLRAALGEPIVIEYSPRGLVSAVGFSRRATPTKATPVARGLLKALVAQFQVAEPSATEREWSARESDLTGIYQARYQRKTEASVEKTKVVYDRVVATGPASAQTTIDHAVANMTFGAGRVTLGALERLGSNETTHIESNGPLPRLDSTLTVDLTLEKTSRLSVAQLAATTSTAADADFRALYDRSVDTRAAIDQGKIAGATFAKLLEGLAETDNAKDTDARKRHARMYAELTAHLRYEGESVGEAARRIHAGDTLSGTLIDSLGNAGSSTAQTALRGVFADSGTSSKQRLRALTALSLTPSPDEQTVQFLKATEQDPEFRRQARYGLGAAAYHLKGQAPERAGSVVADLTTQLASAETVNDTVQYLQALGNAADPASLAAIEPYLASPSESVREVALDALRRIPGQQADLLIAGGLVKDQSADARRAALNALGYRSPSPTLVYALRDSITTEPDRNVRYEAVRAAQRWASKADVLRVALNQVARLDGDEKIRKLAGRAL